MRILPESVLGRLGDFDPMNGELYLDLKTYLADDILVKVDRMSMAPSLEARLEEAGHSVPKTHDLLHLLNLVTTVEPLWSAYQSAFSLLVSYAVQTRYPGSSVIKADARHAMQLCRQFRKEARHSLGLR